MDAIEAHRPVDRLRLLLLGGLVGAGVVVGGIFLSATPAHADGGLLDGVGGVVSDVSQPVTQVVDSVAQTAVPVVEDVTSAVPEPVAEVVQPVVQPVVEQVVLPVVEAVPDAPAAGVVQPVTQLVDPLIAAVPVVGDVLGSTPTGSVTAPVVELADGTVGQVTGTVVTVAPALPGASGTVGPGLIPSLPGLDLPDALSVLDTDTSGLVDVVSAPTVAALSDSDPAAGALVVPVGGATASGNPSGLPAPGQAGSASSSTPSTPGAPAPAGPSEGSPVVLPAPSGSGGQGMSGGAGSGGFAAFDSVSGSFLAHAALTLRALASDDALPASPTFDLGSTPD